MEVLCTIASDGTGLVVEITLAASSF